MTTTDNTTARKLCTQSLPPSLQQQCNDNAAITLISTARNRPPPPPPSPAPGDTVLVLLCSVVFSCSSTTTTTLTALSGAERSRWLLENREEGCTESAVDGACWNGHETIVRWLVDSRGREGSERALDYAASTGRLEVPRRSASVQVAPHIYNSVKKARRAFFSHVLVA